MQAEISEQVLLEKLETYFGYSAFREGQLEIIEQILAGNRVLAVMPTGAGKSLCYQLPATCLEGKTIVVSPLLALMDDQVLGLRDNGIGACLINSAQDREENVAQWLEFTKGTSNILYLSPERLMQPRMIAALQNLDIELFVVDEAHCVSKWGADFRPEYDQLSRLKDLFPKANMAAFTATADKATRADIDEKLTGKTANIYVKGFDRPNLYLEVRPKVNMKSSILSELRERDGQSGIIYCLSRKDVDELTDYLRANGVNALAFHAGRPVDYKKDAQDRFMTEEGVVMVATIAFGMGIDKPDVRFVIHGSLPSSMEAFYQEIGRAGRDGAPADTILYYSMGDYGRRQRMIFDGDAPEAMKMNEQKRLESLVGYCETTSCRRMSLLTYFDEASEPCGNCDNCVKPPEVVDQTDFALKALSVISQSGQFFGAAHIIDVLRGAQSEKVLSRNHDAYNEHGSFSKMPKPVAQSLMRQLIAGGFLKVNLEKYSAVEITANGQALSEGKQIFQAKIEVHTTDAPSKRKEKKPIANLKDDDQLLLQGLKQVRLKLAREKKVAAYVIFSDKCLIDMATKRPKNKEEFLQVNGVGEKKLEAYYEPFAEVIAAGN